MNVLVARPSAEVRAEVIDALRKGLLAGAAIAALVIPPSLPWRPPGAVLGHDLVARAADFGPHTPSTDARAVADWIAASADNAGQPFVIVDKKLARLYVFDGRARLHGASDILLGAAPGDDSVPGIGTRPIEQVRPEERTTPAGRFVARPGRNALGEDVVWVDYDAAVSMHRVRATDPRERRLERLASPSAVDKRISYGCINVPASFYDAFVRPLFAARSAPVYVLPEVKSLSQVFGASVAAHRTAGAVRLPS